MTTNQNQESETKRRTRYAFVVRLHNDRPESASADRWRGKFDEVGDPRDEHRPWTHNIDELICALSSRLRQIVGQRQPENDRQTKSQT